MPRAQAFDLRDSFRLRGGRKGGDLEVSSFSSEGQTNALDEVIPKTEEEERGERKRDGTFFFSAAAQSGCKRLYGEGTATDTIFAEKELVLGCHSLLVHASSRLCLEKQNPCDQIDAFFYCIGHQI